MSTVISSILSWRDRQQTRQTAQRVAVTEDGDDPLAIPSATSAEEDAEVNSITDEEEGQFVGGGRNTERRGSRTPSLTGTEASGVSTTTGINSSSSSNPNAAEEEDYDGEEVGEATDEEEGAARSVQFSEDNTTNTRASTTARRRSGTTTNGRRTLRRADLEEERELVRRRTSACVLLSSFILLRLWIQAVVSGDFGLLLLCLVFTSWTARFIRHTREREEELDRMINEWDDNQEDAVNDARLRRMSFQSQLALAIMQSQMQMMEGGFGHPDGNGNNTPGVSEEAKGRWDRFSYQSSSGFLKGKTKHEDAMDAGGTKDLSESSDDEPHCSICLGEYEDAEKLVMLPCKHIYHDDCISSWCDNHTRCPLCNMDLEAALGVSGEEVV